jgi:exonuclease VII large subunit
MEQIRQDDWLWEGSDYDFGTTEQSQQQQQQNQEGGSDLAKELEAIKQQLQMWQAYMWQQYWTNMVNEAINQLIRQKPYLQAWTDELRAGLAQDVAIWLQQQQQQNKNISWDDVSKFIQEALQKRAEVIENKLSQVGVNLSSVGAPVTLPATGAIAQGTEGRKTSEEVGLLIGEGDNYEIRMVSPDYLEKLMLKQRDDYIRDMIALQQKRRQGGILPKTQEQRTS